MLWTALSLTLLVAPGVGPDPGARLRPASDAARMSPASAAGVRPRWQPGRGVEVHSADRRYSLQFSAFAQMVLSVRHRPPIPAMNTSSTDQPEDFVPAQPARTELGLSIRRARLILDGNLFSPHIQYRVQFTFSPAELGFNDGKLERLPLLDWYLSFGRLRDATVQVGQFKVPYSHQRMIRPSGLQFIDRSSVSGEFNLDRDIGVNIGSRDLGGLGSLRYNAGVYLGDGISKVGPSDFGLAYVARLEMLPFGQYDDLEESDHDRSARPRLLLGGAFAYIGKDPHNNHSSGGEVPADGRKASTLNATADLNFRWSGLSVEGAFFWRKAVAQTPVSVLDGQGNPVDRVEARNGAAYFVQAGVLLPRLPFEVAARWGQIFARGDPTATIVSLKDQSELGGIFNYYYARHAIKLQLEYMHPWSAELRLGSHYVRLQAQAMF